MTWIRAGGCGWCDGLIERALGLSSEEAPTAPAAAVGVPGPETGAREHGPAELGPTPAPGPETGAPANGDSTSRTKAAEQQPEESPVADSPPRLYLVNSDSNSHTPQGAERAQPAAPLPTFRAARYLQPPQPGLARPVTRQDVDRVTRLYEAGDAAHLVLPFGEYRGATLFQVAEIDPVWVYISELPAQHMAEYGHALPEPGSEQTWLDRLPAQDRSSMLKDRG